MSTIIARHMLGKGILKVQRSTADEFSTDLNVSVATFIIYVHYFQMGKLIWFFFSNHFPREIKRVCLRAATKFNSSIELISCRSLPSHRIIIEQSNSKLEKWQNNMNCSAAEQFELENSLKSNIW